MLIIGAGPAGLMAANWLAVQGLGPSVRIIDKRNDKIFNGQADGLQCRSLEILHSFGLGEDIWRQSNRMIEMRFWNPGPDGKLSRTGRKPDTIPVSRAGSSVCFTREGSRRRFWIVLRNTRMASSASSVGSCGSVDCRRSRVDDRDAYPVQVEIRKLSEEEATPTQMGKSVPMVCSAHHWRPMTTPSIRATAVEPGTRERIHAQVRDWLRRCPLLDPPSDGQQDGGRPNVRSSGACSMPSPSPTFLTSETDVPSTPPSRAV